MSGVSFNSGRSYFGKSGEEAIQQMSQVLKSQSLGLTYNPKTRTFTILGSYKLKQKAINELFKNKYNGWQPQVLNKTDQMGNRMVELIEPQFTPELTSILDDFEKKLQNIEDNWLSLPTFNDN